MVSQITQLTRSERNELASLEEVIGRGLNTFHAVGQALLAIQSKRLYRDSYSTFEAYCQEKWSFTRQHAYRLISAAEVVEDVSPIGYIPNEAQARELVPLTTEQRQEVWQQATANGPTTAARLQELTAKAKAGMTQRANDELEGKTPEEVRSRVVTSEREINERVSKEQAAADRRADIAKCLSLLDRARKLVEGLGAEGGATVRAISKAIAVAHALEG